MLHYQVHAMFAENVYVAEGGVTGDNRVAELIRAMPICFEADQVHAAALRHAPPPPRGSLWRSLAPPRPVRLPRAHMPRAPVIGSASHAHAANQPMSQ